MYFFCPDVHFLKEITFITYKISKKEKLYYNKNGKTIKKEVVSNRPNPRLQIPKIFRIITSVVITRGQSVRTVHERKIPGDR